MESHPPAYTEWTDFEPSPAPPSSRHFVNYPPGFVPPPPPPPIAPRPIAIAIPGREGGHSTFNNHPSNDGNTSPPYEVNIAPSTSYGSYSRRPLPYAPGQSYHGQPQRQHTDSRNNTRNDYNDGRDANRAHVRLPSRSGSSPPPAFTASPPQPALAISPERINADLPPTPSTPSSGSAGLRNRHRQSSQSLQSVSTASIRSPVSFNSESPAPWAVTDRHGGFNRDDTIMPGIPVNIHPDPGHVVLHKLFELCMHKGGMDRLPSYGKGEPVTGYVELKTFNDIDEIEVNMQGTLQVVYSERGMPFDQDQVSLFTSSQTLFTSAYKRPPGPSHQFTFTFPETCVASQTPLPPTWSLTKQGVNAKVSYTITAILKRKGFFKKNEKISAEIEYYPRTAPPLPEPTHPDRPKKPKYRALEMEQNLRPTGRSAVVNPMKPTTFTARIILALPLIYASGSTIPYTVTLSSPDGTAVPASLDVEASLVKISKVAVKGKPYEKKDIVSRGINNDRQYEVVTQRGGTGTREGSVVTIKGACGAGNRGQEMSWKVDGMASIKYVLRFVVTPTQQAAEFTAFKDTLPTFEHSEEITLTTDAVLEESEARLPAHEMRHVRHRSYTGAGSSIGQYPISPTVPESMDGLSPIREGSVRDSLRGAARITPRPRTAGTFQM
ncbi:hypothetical protein M408DRAFT_328068 [Serendipita vermifera MAFF 305830]|uniref:Arrestin-like N-terminal domain-containing protein n=1 Tax=Serendipita vermifera MAFF 305830 TaxID=933852 RepID=A0A0C3BG82_SERVB|nr:hypothetical protein M408DRAFT_328068 [Serendipita vermifera MAFF 305830]